jgi:hypothetical protein
MDQNYGDFGVGPWRYSEGRRHPGLEFRQVLRLNMLIWESKHGGDRGSMEWRQGCTKGECSKREDETVGRERKRAEES